MTGSDIVVQGEATAALGAKSEKGRSGDPFPIPLFSDSIFRSLEGAMDPNGKTGGAGGSFAGVAILQGQGILDAEGLFDAGIGGNGGAGNGGAGGAVSNLAAPLADYDSFLVNSDSHGDGGTSVSGHGGAGGAVTNVAVTEPSSTTLGNALAGPGTVLAGRGGDGGSGGGVGGALNNVAILGSGLTIVGMGGNGGDATSSGPGGGGGSVSHIQFTALDNFGLLNQNGVHVSGSIASGTGGRGLGMGAGGAGGNVSLVDLNSVGDANLTAGDGGTGQTATGSFSGTAPGRGGSVSTSGVFGQLGSASIRGGIAGLAGVGASAGGGLLGGSSASTSVVARAAIDVTLMAGNGFGGGAGGNIVNTTYGTTAEGLSPNPSGNIFVQAGDGSAGSKGAGSGGTISGLTGSVTSGFGDVTSIAAGAGGGNESFSGAGGSVSNVIIAGGGASQAIFTIAAGDAGDAGVGVTSNAHTGGKGGSVANVQVIGLDIIPDPTGATTGALASFAEQTIFRSVAAGDGGNASIVGGKGGLGGTISGVFVENHDIGLRTGAVFGYNSAGGLFAGVGGAGATAGQNGSVNHVSANAIASIVAGRTLIPQMAQSVDHILLNDNSNLLTEQSFVQPGAFTFTFGGKTTATLPAGATKQEVQSALNGLSTILAAGGVTVNYGQTPGTYVILFDATGAQVTVTGTEQISGTVLRSKSSSSPRDRSGPRRRRWAPSRHRFRFRNRAPFPSRP